MTTRGQHRRSVAQAAHTGLDVDMLVPKVWDLRDLASRQARIVIEDLDDDQSGHILVDKIEPFDVR